MYLRAVTRDIHLNPVKIAACRPLNGRQRLERLNAYRWSSYAGYVAADKTQEFVTYEVLRSTAAIRWAARRQYRACQRGGVSAGGRRPTRRWPPEEERG